MVPELGATAPDPSMRDKLKDLDRAAEIAQKEAQRLVAADEYSYSELLIILEDLRSEILYLMETGG